MAAEVDDQSLDELEGTSWGPAPEGASRLVATVHDLRRKAIGELTAEDLRLLIGQQIGVPFLLPRAIELLKADPLLEATFYPGDLLQAVLRVPASTWSELPDLAEDLRLALASLQELPDEVRPAVAQFNRDLGWT